MGDHKMALIVIQVVLGVKICRCCVLLTIKWLLEGNDQFAEQKNSNNSWALDTKPTFAVEEAAFGMKQIEQRLSVMLVLWAKVIPPFYRA